MALPIISDGEIGRDLFQMMPVAVALADDDGTIVQAIRPLENLFGIVSRNYLKGKSVDELVHPDRRKTHREHRKFFNANQKVRQMGVGMLLEGYRQCDGATFPCQVMLFPTTYENKACVIFVVSDLSFLPIKRTQGDTEIAVQKTS